MKKLFNTNQEYFQFFHKNKDRIEINDLYIKNNKIKIEYKKRKASDK